MIHFLSVFLQKFGQSSVAKDVFVILNFSVYVECLCLVKCKKKQKNDYPQQNFEQSSVHMKTFAFLEKSICPAKS